MRNEEATVPQWVCTHCFIHLVNDDCTESDTCTPGSGDENDPMRLLAGMDVTPGMLWEHHECDCETNPFSWLACDGYGSNLGGVREAATGWVPVAA